MSKPKDENIKIDGKKEAAELLAALDPKSRDRILGDIARQNPTLAAQLRKGLISFERLLELDPINLQKVLRGFPQDFIALSLRNLTDQEKIRFLSKFSERQARAIVDEMNAMGPRKLTDVKAAQEKLCDRARELSDAGEISL